MNVFFMDCTLTTAGLDKGSLKKLDMNLIMEKKSIVQAKVDGLLTTLVVLMHQSV